MIFEKKTSYPVQGTSNQDTCWFVDVESCHVSWQKSERVPKALDRFWTWFGEITQLISTLPMVHRSGGNSQKYLIIPGSLALTRSNRTVAQNSAASTCTLSHTPHDSSRARVWKVPFWSPMTEQIVATQAQQAGATEGISCHDSTIPTPGSSEWEVTKY